MMPGELPLRVVDRPGGPVIRCLCGAEAALVTVAAERAAPIKLAARSSGPVRRALRPDVSPAAVLRMIAHAKTCQRIPVRQ